MIRPSSLQATALCPGREQAQDGLEEKLEPAMQEMTERGRRVHEMIAMAMLIGAIPSSEECEADDRDMVEWFIDKLNEVMAPHGGVEEVMYADGQVVNGAGNLDLFLPPENKIAVRASGKVLSAGTPDLVVRDGQGILHVIDWKTGWEEQTPAQSNLQIRAYAIAAVQTWDRERLQAAQGTMVYAHMVPYRNNVTSTAYKYAHVAEGINEIDEIVTDAGKKRAKRFPGPEQCRFCAACGTPRCPESVATVEEVQTAITVKDAANLPANRVAELLPLWQVANKVGKALEARAKELLREDPDAVEGYELRPTGKTRSVTDNDALFEDLLESYGFSHSQVLSCFKASVPALIDLMAEELGITKADAAKQFIGDGGLAQHVSEKDKQSALKARKDS